MTNQQHRELVELLRSLKLHLSQQDPLAHFTQNPAPCFVKETKTDAAAPALSPNNVCDKSPVFGDKSPACSELPADRLTAPPITAPAATDIPTSSKDPMCQLPQNKAATKPGAYRDFSELFLWMKNKYPKISITVPKPSISQARVLIIVPEDANDQKRASAFAKDVLRGLHMRKISAQLTNLEQCQTLQKASSRYLLLVDVAVVSMLQSKVNCLEIGADIAEVDWLRCSQSKTLKSELWKAIQLHLQGPS